MKYFTQKISYSNHAEDLKKLAAKFAMFKLQNINNTIGFS